MRSMYLVGLAAGVLAVAACSNSETVGPQVERHHATLAANPGVTTDATGSAEFTVDGSTVTYTLTVGSIDSVTAAHIHVTSSPSTVLANLFTGPTTGVNYSGDLAGANVTLVPRAGVTTDSVLKMVRIPGATYVNVHTMGYRSGELRGDIIRQ